MENREKPFTLLSEKAIEDGLPELPVCFNGNQNSNNQFILLSPQALLRIHSQFEGLPWLKKDSKSDKVFINKTSAQKMDLKNGEEVIIYNENGEIRKEVEWDQTLPGNTIVINQGGDIPINLLIGGNKGKELSQVEKKGSSPFYDLYVSLRKAGGKG